jgi:hypothetical protein
MRKEKMMMRKEGTMDAGTGGNQNFSFMGSVNSGVNRASRVHSE